MRLHPRLAPIKAAIFPLVKKDGMPELAMKSTDNSSDISASSMMKRGPLVGVIVGKMKRELLLHHGRWQSLQDRTITIRARYARTSPHQDRRMRTSAP